MSVREVAEAIGRPASSYSSYEDKYKKPYLPIDLVKSLIPVWTLRGVKEAEILALAGMPYGLKNVANGNSTRDQDVQIQDMPRDLPVLGTGQGGKDGEFEFNHGPIDHVRRPPRLVSVPDAYAVYISGSSMSPWREEGQLVFVHPHQPVRIGDYVVVQLVPDTPGDAPRAFVKRLVRRSEREITVSQFNPKLERAFPAKQVQSIHRIMDWTELLGI